MAWIDANGQAKCMKMSEGDTNIYNQIEALHVFNHFELVQMERAGFWMGKSDAAIASSIVKLAQHVGTLRGFLIALKIPIEKEVTPEQWQKIYQPLPKGSEHKNARKKKIQELMQQRFPNLKVTLATADALGILNWKCRQMNIMPLNSPEVL